MSTPRHPATVRRAFRSPHSLRDKAFSLIEILAVITIIGILMGLGLRVIGGANQTALRSRAEAELAALSTALANYRQTYGDYPQQSGISPLLTALDGRRGPTGVGLAARPFVNWSNFQLVDPDPTTAGNAILDPWERPYVYRYIADTARPRYSLYSLGPDGMDLAVTGTADADRTADANLDNLYANP